MFSKRVAAIAAILAGSLALAACGSGSNPLSTNQTSGAASSGSSAPSSPAASGGQSSASGASSGGASGSAGASSSGAASSSAGGATGSSAAATGGPIVIGSGNFTESELIADIYAAALKAKGVQVSTHLDIGSREVYLKAMQEGSINLLPEYTGGLLAYYDKNSTATSPDAVYAGLGKALPATLEALAMSPAQDQDSVTVTKATADKYHLTSIGDLAKVAPQMTLGGSSEWQTRADGPQGMKKLYGVVFKGYKVLDPGGPLSVKGLQTGLVQATDIFTTDPAIEKYGFVVLKDPKNLFQAQNVVPLIARKVATPAVTAALNAVSAKLTTKALTDMQKTINDTKADPSQVAQKWVSDNGLG